MRFADGRKIGRVVNVEDREVMQSGLVYSVFLDLQCREGNAHPQASLFSFCSELCFYCAVVGRVLPLFCVQERKTDKSIPEHSISYSLIL